MKLKHVLEALAAHYRAKGDKFRAGMFTGLAKKADPVAVIDLSGGDPPPSGDPPPIQPPNS